MVESSSTESQLACLMVMAGFHDFSSSRIERQTVPDGYTFGWNNGGENLPARHELRGLRVVRADITYTLEASKGNLGMRDL
jgi:hypothetical protein